MVWSCALGPKGAASGTGLSEKSYFVLKRYSIIGAAVGIFMGLKSELLEWTEEWMEDLNDQLRLLFRPVKVRVTSRPPISCPPQIFEIKR